MSYTERFKAQVGDAYHDKRLAVERGKMLEYDLVERLGNEAEKKGDMRGAEYHRKQLPAFEEKIKTLWLPHIEKVMVQVKHEREVEKAREEQGFAKAREEAMAKSVVDFSQVFGEGKNEERKRLDALDATGHGTHHAVGEAHPRAKLTDALAQQLRREYWASDRNKGEVKPMQVKYGISKGSFNAVISRASWVHLPRVEGEPEENLKRLSKSETRVAKKAKEQGVEPVRNKLGRLALPADAVAKLRAEKIAKSLATKAKKNSPAGE